MTQQFFLPMLPPTVTAQERRVVKGKGGKLLFFDTPELADARAKLTAHLGRHRPHKPYLNGVRLTVKWLFTVDKNHSDGEYKLTKPDTDNLQKLLKDIMTRLGYWKDDALVASEIVEKFYSETPGIFIKIEELGS
jgi:Holliday junction resolvase RusA-like endonuclease